MGHGGPLGEPDGISGGNHYIGHTGYDDGRIHQETGKEKDGERTQYIFHSVGRPRNAPGIPSYLSVGIRLYLYKI